MEDFEKIKEITLEEAQQILPQNIAYLTMNDGEVIIVNGLDHDKFDKKEKDYESWMEEQSKISKMNTGVKNYENTLHRIQEDTEENERNSNLVNENNINFLKGRNDLKEGNNNIFNKDNTNNLLKESNNRINNLGPNNLNARENNVRENIEINLNQKYYQDNKNANISPNSQNNNNYAFPKTNLNSYTYQKQQRNQQFQKMNNINKMNNYNNYNVNQNINNYNSYSYNPNVNSHRNNININRNGQIMKLCQGTFINSNNRNNNYLYSNLNNNNGYIIYESYFRPYNSPNDFINNPIYVDNMQNKGINRYIRCNNHNFVEIKKK